MPREHTSGRCRRQGSITKTGNGHVRRVLTQAAWCYRFPARKTRHLHARPREPANAYRRLRGELRNGCVVASGI